MATATSSSSSRNARNRRRGNDRSTRGRRFDNSNLSDRTYTPLPDSDPSVFSPGKYASDSTFSETPTSFAEEFVFSIDDKRNFQQVVDTFVKTVRPNLFLDVGEPELITSLIRRTFDLTAAKALYSSQTDKEKIALRQSQQPYSLIKIPTFQFLQSFFSQYGPFKIDSRRYRPKYSGIRSYIHFCRFLHNVGTHANPNSPFGYNIYVNARDQIERGVFSYACELFFLKNRDLKMVVNVGDVTLEIGILEFVKGITQINLATLLTCRYVGYVDNAQGNRKLANIRKVIQVYAYSRGYNSNYTVNFDHAQAFAVQFNKFLPAWIINVNKTKTQVTEQILNYIKDWEKFSHYFSTVFKLSEIKKFEKEGSPSQLISSGKSFSTTSLSARACAYMFEFDAQFCNPQNVQYQTSTDAYDPVVVLTQWMKAQKLL